jgi:hypothetical protein
MLIDAVETSYDMVKQNQPRLSHFLNLFNNLLAFFGFVVLKKLINLCFNIIKKGKVNVY